MPAGGSSKPYLSPADGPVDPRTTYDGPTQPQGISAQGTDPSTISALADPGSGPAPVPAVGLAPGALDPGTATLNSGGGSGGSRGTSSTVDPSPQPSNGYISASELDASFTEIGSSGLKQYGGFVRDEFIPALQGDSGMRVWREMYDNDAVVGSIVFAIQMLVRKVEWRVEPPEAASVEDIVQARLKEKADALARQQQKQQQDLMAAQAGLAANASGSSPTALGPDGKPAQPGQGNQPPRPPGASFARPAGNTPPRHAPINPSQSPGDARPQPPANNQPVTKSRVRTALSFIYKAASGGGGATGGIQPSDVDQQEPIDPETQEPMEFPIGAGPMDPPSPEELKGLELAVLVETCLHDMTDSWADLLSQIVTEVVYGFAFHEIVYKKRVGTNLANPAQSSRFNDGRIGWAALAGRAQETRFRWEFDDQGHVLGMWQLAPPKYQMKYIPLGKALLFRTTAYKNNPEGRSLFRSAYRAWSFKRRIEEIEAIGVERDLAGMPMARVPYNMLTPTATPAEKAALDAIKTLVRNLRRNEQEGIVFPNVFDVDTKQNLYDLTLLGSGSTRRQFDTNAIIQRYEQRIAMTVLAEFITLGMDGMGARSLGDTKVDLFTSALEALLDSIADVFNSQGIPRLMAMNNEDPAMSPTLTYGKLTQVSLPELAAFVTAMTGAGFDMAGDEQLEDALRDQAGLPPRMVSNDL